MSDKSIIKFEIRLPYMFIEGTANRIIELGVGGVEIVDDISPSILRTYIEGQENSRVFYNQISTYINSLYEIFPNEKERVEITLKEIKSEDWAQNWKKYFKPLVVTKRLVIKPTWEVFKELKGQIVINIDPEMAFGTGTHETTRMCLEKIDAIFEGKSLNRPFSFLDVGTGSGLLAITAAKLGAKRVLGIDHDHIAIKTAKKNAQLNSVEDICSFTNRDISMISGSFDLVAANITSDVLTSMAKDISRRQKRGSLLLLTGIVNEKANQVKGGYLEMGYVDFESYVTNEWTLWSAKKR